MPANHVSEKSLTATAGGLEGVINIDGSVKPGSGGSFNARGWQMRTAADGSPRFERTSPPVSSAPLGPQLAGDSSWDNRFLNGVSNGIGISSQVYAMAVSGTDIYVGGSFSQAGGVAANNIARWSTVTHQWFALKNGAQGQVLAILVNGASVYVGGSFNDLDGQSAWSLGRWDTAAQSWSLVGGSPGLSSSGKFVGVVHALALDGSGNLVVAGSFDHAGSVAAQNIARWNGATWSALGSGLGVGGSEVVYALAVSGADIYAGGFFTNPDSYITHWNGTSWSSLGGMNGPVFALALNGNSLYAGGQFTQAGPTPAQHIAVLTGGNWQALGEGTDSDVTAIVLGPGGYYVSGNFLMAGTATVNHAALWTGSTWYGLGNGTDGESYSLAVNGSDVYVGGSFLYSDFGGSNTLTNHISRWNTSASTWYPLGNSLDELIFAVAIQGGDVYVGGTFNSAGGVPVNNIARWSSSTGRWYALGSGVTGCTGTICTPAVMAIAVNGPEVFVGGNFFSAGSQTAAHMARWDTLTSSWTSGFIGPCAFTCVYALAAYGSGVYVGGFFTQAGQAVTANNVVYWNGSNTYTPLSDGVTVGTNDLVHAIQPDGFGGVYIGGNFTSPRAHLAYFDGVDWFGVGSPLNDIVESLALDNNYLYAGGLFLNAGGSGANKIARISMLSPGDWQPLGSSLDGNVLSMAFNGKDLIAAGRFTQSGLTGVSHIARWDTTTETWSPIGSGASDDVRGLAATPNEIYAIGLFTQMGGKESDYFARWASFHTLIPVSRK